MRSVRLSSEKPRPQALAKEACSSTTSGLPTESSASPFRVAIVRTQPMRGKFFADGEVKPLWDLLVGGERELAGHVQMQGTLSGTLADPRAVYDGGFELSGEREELCLARLWPEFSALAAEEAWEDCTRELYGPLADWLQQHITIDPISAPDEGAGEEQ